jgi:hypothetical protein
VVNTGGSGLSVGGGALHLSAEKMFLGAFDVGQGVAASEIYIGNSRDCTINMCNGTLTTRSKKEDIDKEVSIENGVKIDAGLVVTDSVIVHGILAV